MANDGLLLVEVAELVLELVERLAVVEKDELLAKAQQFVFNGESVRAAVQRRLGQLGDPKQSLRCVNRRVNRRRTCSCGHCSSDCLVSLRIRARA